MESDSVPILECEQLGFAYPGKPPLFQHVTLSVAAGDFLLITGPSGSGKSTFLRLVARFAEPTAGTLRFHGEAIRNVPAPQLRRRIAYLQQSPVLVDGSVRHNLFLPFTFKANQHLPLPDDAFLEKSLDPFLLTGLALDQPARNLSGGQKQRLCFLRSVLLDPEIMLLDEPVSALDPESRRAVEIVTETLCRERGIAVIAVSHQPLRVDLPRTRIYELRDGRFSLHETPIEAQAGLSEETPSTPSR